jgi:ubiquinone/menaquinone biosynthesis C-methylase UbiE
VSDEKENSPSYVQKRSGNNAFWTDRALKGGSSLSATAATGWVRSASLRRLRKFIHYDDRTLEVGCGNASSLLAPLSRKCRAFGVDLTLEMLRVAKQHADIQGLARSDACWLPFGDQSFDVVYTSRCLINVLDPEMQRVAVSEVFRVAKPNGTVILIENFEEPLARLNRARERFHAGPPIVDAHNLRLKLDVILEHSRQLGWVPATVKRNTIASVLSQVVIPRITRGVGSSRVERLLYPLYEVLTRAEDTFGKGLPIVGKDVMLVFRRSS